MGFLIGSLQHRSGVSKGVSTPWKFRNRGLRWWWLDLSRALISHGSAKLMATMGFDRPTIAWVVRFLCWQVSCDLDL
uniref:Uncharacterized protein n=1 Tax=Fagus sylvatica TaxID=28930 RepID=A0A2N9FCZ7_FAGSY